MAVVQANLAAAQRQVLRHDTIKSDGVRVEKRVLLCRRKATSGFLAGARVTFDFVGNLLAFAQRAEASALDGADVHEHVLAAVVGLDEAKALGRVKPLHGSHAHGGSSFSDNTM